MASSITPKPIYNPGTRNVIAWFVPMEAVGYYLHTDGEVRRGVRHSGQAKGYFDNQADADAAVVAMLARREAMR